MTLILFHPRKLLSFITALRLEHRPIEFIDTDSAWRVKIGTHPSLPHLSQKCQVMPSTGAPRVIFYQFNFKHSTRKAAAQTRNNSHTALYVGSVYATIISLLPCCIGRFITFTNALVIEDLYKKDTVLVT